MGKDIPTEAQILEALKNAQGSQRQAAEILSMSQSWLARWLKANGYKQVISWEKRQ